MDYLDYLSKDHRCAASKLLREVKDYLEKAREAAKERGGDPVLSHSTVSVSQLSSLTAADPARTVWNGAKYFCDLHSMKCFLQRARDSLDPAGEVRGIIPATVNTSC